MADIEYDLYEEARAPRDASVAGLVLNWGGALLSVVLVVGLTTWGYKLTMRDAGAVPVVRALAGPMHRAPEDPGGVDAAYQGLAVNTVQADGGVDGPVDRVTLAPAPTGLAEDDRPRAQLRPPTRAAALEQGVHIPAALRIDPVSDNGDPGPLGLTAEQEAEAEAVIVAVAVASAPARAAAPERLALANLPGVRVSPRPHPRPVLDISTLRNATNTSSLSGTDARDDGLDPALLAPGTRLVQLGAYDDEQTARAEWVRIVGVHADLLDDKQRVIQKAESGGRSFYRLRAAGFDGIDDARRFCSALLARGAACIPVTVR